MATTDPHAHGAGGSGALLVALELGGVPVLVVGGGRVARRRAAALIAAGARVTVVAPELNPDLAARAGGSAPELTWHERPFAAADLDGPWRLVVAAVDDPAVDAAVVDGCRARGLWCSSAMGGGTVRHVAQRAHGPLTLAVDSGGRSPTVAARLADRLAAAAEGLLPAEQIARWERDGWPRDGAGGTP